VLIIVKDVVLIPHVVWNRNGRFVSRGIGCRHPYIRFCDAL